MSKYYTLEELGLTQQDFASNAPASPRQTQAQKQGTHSPFDAQNNSVRAALIGAKRVWDGAASTLEQGFNKLTGNEIAFNEAKSREQEYDRQYEGIKQEFPIATTVGNVSGNIALAAPISAGIGAIPALARFSAASPLKGLMANAAATGAIAEGSQYRPDESLTDTAKRAAQSAAVSGGVSGALGAVLRPAASSLSPEAQRIARDAQGLGITLTPGQLTGSSIRRRIEAGASQAPISSASYDKLAANNASAINRAAIQQMGGSGERVTPDLMEGVKDAANKAYTQLSANNYVALDRSVLKAATIAEREAAKSFKTAPPELQNAISAIREAASPDSKFKGVIPGDLYQQWRSELGAIHRTLRNESPRQANIVKSLQKSLDNAFEKGLSATESATKKQVDKQYAAYKTVDKLVQRGGVTPEGNLSPTQLATVLRSDPMRRVGGVDDNLQKLANYGKQFPPLPDSGTASRIAFNPLTLGGAGAAAVSGGPMSMLAGGGLLGGNALYHAAATSPKYQNLIMNGIDPRLLQMLAGPSGAFAASGVGQ